jgi:hypothetical protein
LIGKKDSGVDGFLRKNGDNVIINIKIMVAIKENNVY